MMELKKKLIFILNIRFIVYLKLILPKVFETYKYDLGKNENAQLEYVFIII